MGLRRQLGGNGMQDAGLPSRKCSRAAVGGHGKCAFARTLLVGVGVLDLGVEAPGFAKKLHGGVSLIPLPSPSPAGKHQGFAEERKLSQRLNKRKVE